MNWCNEHWAMLRQAIDKRGLTQFVAADGEEAANLIQKEIDGKTKTFEPLIGSWARINQKMLSSPALKGRMFHCPLCILVEDGQPELVQDWIDGVTDDAMQFAIQEGLVPRQ